MPKKRTPTSQQIIDRANALSTDLETLLANAETVGPRAADLAQPIANRTKRIKDTVAMLKQSLRDIAELENFLAMISVRGAQPPAAAAKQPPLPLAGAAPKEAAR